MDGVGLSNQNLYDDGDIEHMKGLENLSTNAAINRIGNDAGLDTTHAIHGSDKTSKEIVAAHREAVRQEWSPVAVAPDAVGHVAGHAAEHLAEHGARFAFRAMAGAALPIHLVMFAKEMADAVAADSVVGHERAEALAHADVAQRIAEDPAFKAGFEGAVYGREHGNYDAMMTALDARDARYAQHNVGLRG